ncbi:UvrD-helicase domain-containing protein [Moellerella wisconsensis]|uniref:UvrD-helicase domain-containing protein n=1 Tax=Moellerella wisconsensis TaxID=158849 RepID=UPI001F4DF873|nr:UvrD-helicase domain-containing protein [Moellerella wisconsensis]UNH27888.1 UvrD-helicase domain-containing protein [Moellerella wisconsensis]
MNNEQNNLIITPNFIGKLFGKVKKVELNRDEILCTSKNGDVNQYSIKDIKYFPTLSKGLLGYGISFKLNESAILFRFLSKKNIDLFHEKLEDVVANNLENRFKFITDDFDTLTQKQFLRDSDIPQLNDKLKPIVARYSDDKEIFNKHFSSNLVRKLDYLCSNVDSNGLNKEQVRKDYEENILKSRKDFFDVVESNPLTQQQRLSVIRNNDINMVLAAAGTGKTSVMVAKALDLIDSGKATSDEILILAYNKDAAIELTERLEERAKQANLELAVPPSISTFHALGRNIIKSCGKSVRLSKIVEDTAKFDLWFTKWLENYIKEDPDNLPLFLLLSYQPVDPFQFKTKGEYDRYIRDNEYRTLQGERVRGYQELLIANWLFMNGIQYEYEPRYVSKRRIEIGFDYKPDFGLEDGIYLEHFGIDRQGGTRPDIDSVKYNADIEKKRLLHQEHNTTLLETYHYNWTENNLYKRLEQLMQEQFIAIRPRTDKELRDALEESGIFQEGKNRYLKCLQAIRTERLNYTQVLKRLTDAKIVYAKEYATFLMRIHDAYVKQLSDAQEIDFDDMILQATYLIKDGSFKPKWKHILVDEFQDISMSRLELLKEIYQKGPRPIWTVVGDDWQSIYRFSGGKLEVTTQFNKMIGSHTLSKLEKTYRYNNSIADTAGHFIMQNPEQYKKNVVTHTQVNESCIHLHDSYIVKNGEKQNNISLKAFEIYKKIREQHPEASIAILARYRYLIKEAKDVIKDQNVKFWTFHGSKGLEADYCILLGFFQGKTGFPNENKEEAVIEALLPTLDDYPHSEERRLFYVALTRAKKESYLIADVNAPSEFINELLSPQYKLDIASDGFKSKYRKIFKCPVCSIGYFVLKSGKFGNFYSCTSGSVCRSSPRICEKCGSPSVDTANMSICQNPNCQNSFPICDKCGRPMRLREGKFGKFWGCSGYGIKDDPCSNTRKYFI